MGLGNSREYIPPPHRSVVRKNIETMFSRNRNNPITETSIVPIKNLDLDNTPVPQSAGRCGDDGCEDDRCEDNSSVGGYNNSTLDNILGFKGGFKGPSNTCPDEACFKYPTQNYKRYDPNVMIKNIQFRNNNT